jgi:hypothetical protein
VEEFLFSADGQAFAVLEEGGAFSLRELATGRELLGARLGPAASCLTLSPDGRRLAFVEGGRRVRVVELAPPGWRPPGRRLGPAELGRLWRGLADPDGKRAYAAFCTLSRAPAEAVPFLRRQLPPVPRSLPARLRRLVAELDHDEFARREAASRELARLGGLAVPLLRKTLEEPTSLEVRARAQALLKGVSAWAATDPETARALRAVWVLQRAGTAEARALLGELAEGLPEARQTQAAKDALGWLKGRKAPPDP